MPTPASLLARSGLGPVLAAVVDGSYAAGTAAEQAVLSRP
jgi:hypothetical protein